MQQTTKSPLSLILHDCCCCLYQDLLCFGHVTPGVSQSPLAECCLVALAKARRAGASTWNVLVQVDGKMLPYLTLLLTLFFFPKAVRFCSEAFPKLVWGQVGVPGNLLFMWTRATVSVSVGVWCKRTRVRCMLG